MNHYTKEQILQAAKEGEVSMIDAQHIVSILEGNELNFKEQTVDICAACFTEITYTEIELGKCLLCEAKILKQQSHINTEQPIESKSVVEMLNEAFKDNLPADFEGKIWDDRLIQVIEQCAAQQAMPHILKKINMEQASENKKSAVDILISVATDCGTFINKHDIPTILLAMEQRTSQQTASLQSLNESLAKRLEAKDKEFSELNKYATTYVELYKKGVSIIEEMGAQIETLKNDALFNAISVLPEKGRDYQELSQQMAKLTKRLEAKDGECDILSDNVMEIYNKKKELSQLCDRINEILKYKNDFRRQFNEDNNLEHCEDAELNQLLTEYEQLKAK